MQQVSRSARFWWRVQDASVEAAAVPEDPRERMLRQGWRLPSLHEPQDELARDRLVVSAADRSRFSRPRASSRRRSGHLPAPRPRLAAAIAALMLAASAGAFVALQPFAAKGVGADLTSRWSVVAQFAGLGIDTVELSGHYQASENAILDAIDLGNVGTIASLDWDAVRERIERAPWVDRASLTFAYPATLRVAVTERRPFAQWQRGPLSFLVDKTGRTLTEVQPTFRAGLPIIAGEGAPEAAPALFEVLAQYPRIGDALAVAERTGERRWTLRLANGSRIELGPGAEGDGLALVSENSRLTRTLLSQPVVVDVRARHRATVRPAEPDRLAGLIAANGGVP